MFAYQILQIVIVLVEGQLSNIHQCRSPARQKNGIAIYDL